MGLQPIYVLPGVSQASTDYSLGHVAGFVAGRVGQGRVWSCDKVRTVAGFWEKIGGWVGVNSTAMEGRPSSECEWLSIAGQSLLAIGTSSHLYYFNGTAITDITPVVFFDTGTLSSAVTATMGSATVAIADNSQKLVNGDWVFLSSSAAVGGITLDGYYPVSARTSSGYNITFPSAAPTSQSSGGGTLTFAYPRVTLTSPFTTTSGSNVVKVTHTGSNVTTGQFVTFTGATTFNNVTISGEYQVTNIDANDYSIVAGTTANANGSGGGSVSVVYDVYIPLAAASAGSSNYGSGAYGIGPYSAATFQPPSTVSGWTLAAYGSQMLANPIGGTIYVFDPLYGGRAYPLLNAPAAMQAMFVTPERFVVALGINGNYLQIAWPDQNNYTDWTPTATNTANIRTIQGGSYFVGGIAVVNGASLIFTDKCCFAMLYTAASGDAEIYATPVQADNAGLLSPWAVVAQNGAAYWMSSTDFWMWNGSVSSLPSDDIRDYVFEALNSYAQGKCFAGLVRTKKEVWFWYPAGGSSEISNYVIFYQPTEVWSIGTTGSGFTRTCWKDADLLPSPMACDQNGYLSEQETGTDANGTAMLSYLYFPPVELANGDRTLDMFEFIPDFQQQSGLISLNILTRQYPQQTNTITGPFQLAGQNTPPLALTQKIDLRIDGRMMGFELVSNVVGGNFRLGLPRVLVQPAGARR